jgi:YspA, cpYpsA-related SLOG family
VKAEITNETWLICGGGDFADRTLFDSAMAKLLRTLGYPRKIVRGAESGVAGIADAWAQQLAIEVAIVSADWDAYGVAAAHIRNEDMLAAYAPRRVIAFPGGEATADMVRRAKNRGGQIDVIEIH